MFNYDKIRECVSFWDWLYSEWNFICGHTGERERGIRVFGFVFRNGKCTC